MSTSTHLAIEAVYRIEAPRLMGALTRLTRDLSTAEELAQDALVSALEQWPTEGIPSNPGAWLMAAAKHRAIDRIRHQQRTAQVRTQIEQAPPTPATPSLEQAIDEGLGDDVLRLLFAACHPVLSADSRVALTLRLVGGLTTAEIARAYLTSEPTVAQRLVRAKRTLGEAQVAFEVPSGPERAERLESVLECIYLIFNEGYSATHGSDWLRPGLCQDALRLARVLATHAPDEAEAQGLLALLELQASRFPARTTATGAPVTLLEQDRSKWDRLLIARGRAALARAVELSRVPGPYTLQAAIAECHARALTADQTDWARIAALYASLVRRQPSPVIELNRAVAVSMAEGAAVALPLVEALEREEDLDGYALLPAVKGDLLAKLKRTAEAIAAFRDAAALTQNERERGHFLSRIEALTKSAE